MTFGITPVREDGQKEGNPFQKPIRQGLPTHATDEAIRLREVRASTSEIIGSRVSEEVCKLAAQHADRAITRSPQSRKGESGQCPIQDTAGETSPASGVRKEQRSPKLTQFVIR